MAAMTGLVPPSMVAISAGVSGSARGLPNSVMSAPATKARPAPMSTTAAMLGSASAVSSAALSATRSAWPSAFTGGLSIVRTAIAPSRSLLTKFVAPLIAGPLC